MRGLHNLLASETPESSLLSILIFSPPLVSRALPLSCHCFLNSSWVAHARSAGPKVASQEESDVLCGGSHGAPGKETCFL